MRINKFLSVATDLSRRSADQAIEAGRVVVNSQPARTGQMVGERDRVTLDGHAVHMPATTQTILLHKPVGFVVSRSGQGSSTIYDLLPAELRALKPIGRLDKDSSGLLLLTNDGQLAYELTHPKFQKTKMYEATLGAPLAPLHHQMIADHGVQLEDGPSRLQLEKLDDTATRWRVTMHEGRNRQIRRTFAALGYTVTALHRVQFGTYTLGALASGVWRNA
ncbi:MAG TPA: pseudouridine synthase [Candidatus Saccharimonadales bacterium]|nr:pseudouridine synthase [Candidatus Saccharimonadales bacterium]